MRTFIKSTNVERNIDLNSNLRIWTSDVLGELDLDSGTSDFEDVLRFFLHQNETMSTRNSHESLYVVISTDYDSVIAVRGWRLETDAEYRGRLRERMEAFNKQFMNLERHNLCSDVDRNYFKTQISTIQTHLDAIPN